MLQQPQITIDDFVHVNLVMSPSNVPYELFGIPLILGDSNVISVAERFRSYNDIIGVGDDFPNTSPEFLAAEIYFEQQPTPDEVYIGRWASTATSGQLYGSILTPLQASLANFNAVTNGSFALSIDGAAHNFTALNFSAALNMNGVASIIQTAIRVSFTGSTCVWDSNNTRFVVSSGTTGAASTVSFASTLTTLGGSTDVSSLLGLNGGFLSPGVAAETALSAVQAQANASTQWYGLAFASTVQPSISNYLSVASYILASSRSRIFGVNILTTDCLNNAIQNDLASQIQALGNNRVFWMYSSNVAYPVMTMMGRAFTVDFNGADTTITLAYKQAPGVPGEYLTETQFETLVSKGGNVNINVQGGATMIWPGQMSNATSGEGPWFDEIHNTDWWKNKVQTDLFNELYSTPTKIPQTDKGNQVLVLSIEGSCAAAINNGMAAPGIWNAPGFGSLQQGMALTAGFYVFCPLIATQSETDREARKSVTIQTALKLAGAVQNPYVILNVNR